MNYYAPFYRPMTYYSQPMQNGLEGQNYTNQGYSNATYPNSTQNPNQQVVQNQSFSNNDMIWVLNKNEADAYPVAPNCTVTLWDKSETVIYLKSMSSNGVPSMRIIDYNERTENPVECSTTNVASSGINYVTKDEITAIKGKINDLTERFEQLEKTQTQKIEEKQKTIGKKVKENE